MRKLNSFAPVAAGAALMASAGAAMAAETTTQQVTALIEQFKTDGALIAGGLTLAIFVIAAAKWLRRAK